MLLLLWQLPLNTYYEIIINLLLLDLLQFFLAFDLQQKLSNS